MDENTRIDVLKFLSQTHRSLHEQRRKYEIQVLVGAATFYVFAVAAKLSGKAVSSRSGEFCVITWAFCLVVAGFTSAFLRRLHRANRTNISLAESAEDALATVVGSTQKPQTEGRRYHMVGWLWQTGLLFVFALASAFLLTRQ